MKAWQFWVSYVTAVAIAAVFWWGLIGEPRSQARAAAARAEAISIEDASRSAAAETRRVEEAKIASSDKCLAEGIVIQATGNGRLSPDCQRLAAYRRAHPLP